MRGMVVNDKQLGIRLPGPLVDAVDRFAESVKAELPQGVRFTRSDAIRTLLIEALAAAEANHHHPLHPPQAP